MALIHADTKEVMKSELELFSIHPTQTSIEETKFVKYYPQTSIERSSSIEFVIHSDKEYIDPSNIFLYLKARILDEDGKRLSPIIGGGDNDIPAKSMVFPINYFHATCFKSVEVYINNTNVGANDTLYPYRAYIEMLLSYSKNTKDEQLKAAMYYKDKDPLDEHSDAVTKKDQHISKNLGAVSRFLRTSFSKPFETFGRLHSEIFSQDKLLIGNIELNIKLQRAHQNFALMAAEDHRYTISIDSAILYVCHKRISDSIREAHQLTLQKSNIKYPVRKVQMKFFTRGPNRSDISEQNVVNGILPRRLLFTLVDSEAFNGSLSKNPFNFQHFELASITLRKNGENIPFQEIEMDFENKCSLQGYLTLLEGTNLLFKDRAIDIQPFLDFPHGYALYAFDLTTCHSGGNNFDLIQQGNISLELKLTKPCEHALVVLTYLEFDAIVEISADGSVTYE